MAQERRISVETNRMRFHRLEESRESKETRNGDERFIGERWRV